MSADGPHDSVFDCVVVGGGPAGLTAALYLGRFRRTVVVFDAGASRAEWIPRSHNLPGFPGGAQGKDLLEALRRQVQDYGIEILRLPVADVGKSNDRFIVRAEDRVLASRTVVLASGVLEVLPPVPHIAEAIRAGAVRVCPICDGFEAQGRKLAVLGRGDHAAREALFLRTYSDDLTLVLERKDALSDEMAAASRAAEINILHADLCDVSLGDAGARVFDCDRAEHEFDLVYSAYGVTAQTGAVSGLGPAVDEHGRLIVSDHQETSVSRLFAAGDIVRGLNQIAVAEGEAAIAATAVHNRLQVNHRPAGPSRR